MRALPLPVALVVVALAAASACTPPPVGQGPIRLSPKVQAYYESYRKHMSPGAFAVSADGQEFGGTVCGEFGGCRGDDVSQALSYCRRSGKECFLYDVGGKIVWNGPTLPPQTAPRGVPAARGGGRNPV